MSRFKDSWGKAKIILSQLLCIGAIFTACTDDEVFNQTTKALQVSVSTEAPAESRAIIDGGYLPDGASIGVTLTAEDGTAYDGQVFTNLQYTAAGEGSAQAWSSATPASLSITAGKVIAYYPYYGGDDFDLKAVPVETASQTDYMYAKPVTGINMVSPAANLTMQHAMTDIRINVKKGTYTGTGEVTKITAKAPAFATSATMDVETGVFANVSGGGAQFVQELAGTAISSGNVVHDFLIVPDVKSRSGEVSIFVIIDGKKFAVTVPYTESFQQGFAYTYNLTLDNAALTLDGVSVAKWGVKEEVDESLKFYDDQYIVEIQVPSDNYSYRHNVGKFVGTIDWGDGTTTEYISPTGSSNVPEHTYATAGTYTVKAEGRMTKLDSQLASKNITKLVRIGKDMGVTDMNRAFQVQTLLAEIMPGALDGCTEVTDFRSTFSNCSSLQAIPVGLFDKCTKVISFNSTFSSCDILTDIPEGLFDYNTEVTSFEATFRWCSELKTIPEGLFDNNTKVENFDGTFSYCSVLQSIPKGLFDKCIKVTDFSSVFRDCESLTEIPSGLFDYNTLVKDFGEAFQETGIANIPDGLFDKCPEVTSFWSTFLRCENLQQIPEGLFDYNTKVTDFIRCFWDCKELQEIPQGLFDKCTEVTNFDLTFAGCKSLTSIPEGLFDKCTKVTSFYSTFKGMDVHNVPCDMNIQQIPEKLFDYNTKVTDFQWTFSNCSALIAIPVGLFDNCTEVTNFGNTFSYTGITFIPEGLFDYNTKATSYESTFKKTAITNIPAGLFDKNTKVTSFGGAFEGTAITEIPEGLFDNCTEVTSFGTTFYGCSALTAIPEGLFDNCTAVTSFYATFAGCSALTAIPVGLFDNCTKVKDFGGYSSTYYKYGTFYDCKNITGESPYTIIQVNGVDTKVHLYERSNYPEYFTAPINMYGCFGSCTKLSDYSTIPSGWK